MYRLRKFVGRNRSAVAAACAVLLMLIVAAGLGTALAVRSKKAEVNIRAAHREQSGLRAAAERDRERALRSADTAHLHEYVADINLGHSALAEGNIAKALFLLDRQALARPGKRDLRGFEWREYLDAVLTLLWLRWRHEGSIA